LPRAGQYSVAADTTAERRHQLRIESAPMREFCAYNKNCLRPWLAAQIGGYTRTPLPGIGYELS
jgi:hypothetical protein